VSTLAIVLIVLAALLLLLFAGGYVANARRRAAERAALHAQAEQADQHLAAAHAEDKGWERSVLEAAARAAAGPGVREVVLVAVVDRPGTDEDEAVFDADGRRIVLARRGDDWVPRGQAGA